MKTLCIPFFLELSTRRVHLAGVTSHPNFTWVTQQACNLTIDERLHGARFLIGDLDAKYTRPFDEVFCAEGALIIRTPIRAPMANAWPSPNDS